MITDRYTGDLHAVLKWAVNRRYQEPPDAFDSYIRKLIPPDCQATMGHFLNVSTPDTPFSGDWLRGYPHSHVTSVDWDPTTVSAITYLTVADEGGEFGLGGLNRDDPYELITPEPGLTVVLGATVWHGARRVYKGTRISLVTTGVPV